MLSFIAASIATGGISSVAGTHVNPNITNLTKEFLSKKDIAQLESLKVATELDKVVVTCMGLYNHGKSTLLNALINDCEQTTFKTADIRETTKNKAVEQENIIFVDTPGLNATENDDKRVMDAIKESDINLFVHTVTTGEFTEKEIEFFHKVQKNWKNPQEFLERTIFVLSRIDKANDDNDVEVVEKRMREQIKNIFSSDSRFISVSALRYINGMKNDQKIIVKKSNLNQLNKLIEGLRLQYLPEIKETRKLRLQKYYDELLKIFNARLQEDSLQLTELKRVRKNIQKDIKRTEATLEQKYEKLEEEL